MRVVPRTCAVAIGFCTPGASRPLAAFGVPEQALQELKQDLDGVSNALDSIVGLLRPVVGPGVSGEGKVQEGVLASSVVMKVQRLFGSASDQLQRTMDAYKRRLLQQVRMLALCRHP